MGALTQLLWKRRPVINTAANLIALNQTLAAGQVAQASDTGIVYRGPGAISTLTPDNASPLPDLSMYSGSFLNWTIPSPYLVSSGSTTMVAQRELWTIVQWTMNKNPTLAAINIVTGAVSNVVFAVRECTPTGGFGTQIGRFSTDGNVTGWASGTLSRSIRSGEFLWVSIYSDGTPSLLAAASLTRNFLGCNASQPLTGFGRSSITPYTSALTSSAPSSGIGVFGGAIPIVAFK